MPPRVVVVGAGNTAIDAAIASVRLGSNDVHIVYRRGPEQMSAFSFEYEHARLEGVKFLWHVQPTRILGGRSGGRPGADHTWRASTDGSIIPQPGSEFILPADLVVLAIGQANQTGLAEKLQLQRGRIVIDRATGQTSIPKYFAGGDCINGGREVVDAVADGKRAGIGIAAWLGAKAWLNQRSQPPSAASAARIRSGWPPAPPTNCGEQIMRAFDAGWGGAVWKTIGEPIINVSSRYSSIDWNGQRMMGFNNIELISDRPIEINLREIAEVKEALSEARRHRVAHGRIQARSLARHREARRRRRRRRPRAQLRLPARHERARHGLRRRPGARILPA